jgi:uncharacterized RDD family membrane protein YckC
MSSFAWRQIVGSVLLFGLVIFSIDNAHAINATLAPATTLFAAIPQAADMPPNADDWDSDSPTRSEGHSHRNRRQHHGNNRVSIGHDSTLSAGERADAVVSILGSSSSEGEADGVVSVFGNTRVTGPVSDAAVSVVGNTYVDSKVGSAVTVLGDLELGPHAEVDGNVVVVLGKLTRAPEAIVHGSVQNIMSGDIGAAGRLGPWIRQCLLYGRLLALDSNLGWAWGLAAGYLAFYMVLALLFGMALTRCVNVLEREPGHVALTALLAILLTPIVLVLLGITLIGLAAIPVLAAAIFCTGLFGKAVVLTWVGRRVTGHALGPTVHPVVALLIGGLLVAALYVVPLLGMLTFQLLGFFGFGAVLYTVTLNIRSRQLEKSSSNAQTAAADPAQASVAADTSARDETFSPSASAALQRAGFWVRMAALLIDVILVGIVLTLLHPLVHFHLLLLATYGAVMWKLNGSTLGGRLLDLRVVRLDGREITWETAIVRALGCFLSLAIAGLGFVWIAFDGAHQGWHDKIAGTVVVRLPKP